MAECPSAGELDRFFREELKEGDRRRVADHIGNCPRCQAWLDGSTEEDVADLRRALRLPLSTTGMQDLCNGEEIGRWDGDTDATAEGTRHSDTTETIPDRRDDPPAGMSNQKSIGKYIVVDRIDGGGEGSVYRVIHPGLNRELVLKLAHKTIADDPAGRDRLAASGRLLAGLDHPNLVRVVDLDIHEGRPFLVMEYVPGRHLEQYAADCRLTPRQSARLVAELAGVLDYLHARGMTHLDLKPRNVLIDESGWLRLIDFGMARLRDAWSDTPGGFGGGTPSYLAPEQARGEVERVGPAADIFGLGGVLYFLLTGRPPYSGSKSVLLERARRGEYDAEASVCGAQQWLPQLFRKSPATGPSGRKLIPPPLARICHKAMAADPVDRYASAGRLRRDLFLYVWRWWIAAGRLALLLILVDAALLLARATRPVDPPPGPRVESAMPSGLVGTAVVGRVMVTFNRAIDTASFTADDVTLAGPSGAVPVAKVTPVGASGAQFEVRFAAQSAPGKYSLAIGPGVLDTSGSPMDQDGDGLSGEAGEDRFLDGFTVHSADARRFDFGTPTSPLAAGWTRVTEATAYSPGQGYGWASGRVKSLDRPGTATDDVSRDFNFTRDATFLVDLANGTYDVTLVQGNALHAQDDMEISLEDTAGNPVTTAAGHYETTTRRVVVSDGQLTLRLRDLGGDANSVINSLIVERVGN